MRSGGKVQRFLCPHLGGFVELTGERELHILARHPELLPDPRARIAAALFAPDSVRLSGRRSSARMFSRQFDEDLQAFRRHAPADPILRAHKWIKSAQIVAIYRLLRLAGG